jgi:hypothetical protein
VVFENPAPVVAVDLPIGLHHFDSEFCWCDPIIEVDQNGCELVLHRHLTWH